MNPQLHLDFTQTRHNNKESSDFYEENMDRFAGKCQELMKVLRRGVRLTVKDAMNIYDISSLPRRVADVNEAYVKMGLPEPIKDDWIRDENGKKVCKYYYL